MRGSLAMAVVLGLLTGAAVAGEQAGAGLLAIPAPIQEEHQALLSALDAALKAGGKTGEAAAQLEKVLMPHFAREEAVALPPLGALRPCAEGRLSGAMAERARTLSLTLRKELPSMLEEHRAISAAVQKLREVALAEGKTRVVGFAEALAGHAKTEEEVLYPAAILVARCFRGGR